MRKTSESKPPPSSSYEILFFSLLFLNCLFLFGYLLSSSFSPFFLPISFPPPPSIDPSLLLLSEVQHTVSLILLSTSLQATSFPLCAAKESLPHDIAVAVRLRLLAAEEAAPSSVCVRPTREGDALLGWGSWLRLQPFLLDFGMKSLFPLETSSSPSSSFYQSLSADPPTSSLFALAMAEFTAYQTSSLLPLRLFHRCDSICDIAGGNGALLSSIRDDHWNKSLVTILIDSSDAAIEQARSSHFSKTYQIDFFDLSQMEVPLSQCECVVTKGIVSDLTVDQMRTFLSLVTRLMRPSASFFILDHFLFDDSPALSPSVSPSLSPSFASLFDDVCERFKWEMSLLLYSLLGSRQYTISEMEREGERLGVHVRVKKTTSPLVVVEIWKERGER